MPFCSNFIVVTHLMILVILKTLTILFVFTAQPIHWNYKTEKLDSLLEGAEEVAFWDPSQNPFYTLPLGSNSCYGDQSFVILKSLVENKGMVSVSSLPLGVYTIMILSFWTNRSGQTVQTQIRLLLEEQSDQGLHCLLFHLYFIDKIPLGLASLFEF